MEPLINMNKGALAFCYQMTVEVLQSFLALILVGPPIAAMIGSLFHNVQNSMKLCSSGALPVDDTFWPQHLKLQGYCKQLHFH